MTKRRWRLLAQYVVLLVTLCCCSPIAAVRTLRVGVLGAATGDGAIITGGKPFVNGRLWRQHVFNNGGIGDTGIIVELMEVDTQSNLTLTAIATEWLIDQGATILSAPEGAFVEAAAKVAEIHQVPIVSGMSGSPWIHRCTSANDWPCTKADDSRRFDYLFSPFTPVDNYYRGLYAMLKAQGATRTAIITSNSTLGAFGSVSYAVAVGARADAIQYRQDVILFGVIQPAETPADEDAQILGWLNQLALDPPDSLILSWAGPGCQRFAALLYQTQYSYGAIAMQGCVDGITGPRPPPYVVSASQWDQRLTGGTFVDAPRGQTFGNLFAMNRSVASPLQYSLAWRAQTGFEPSYLCASQMAGFYAIEFAVATSNSTAAIDLYTQLQRLYMPSFFGLLSTDDVGANSLRPVITVQQRLSGHWDIVEPIDQATSSFIYPMPTYSERTYHHQMFAKLAEVLIVILVLVAIVVTIPIAILLVRYRYQPFIRATSLAFSLPIIGGAILSYLAVLTWPIENNEATCAARIPCFLLGFVIMICPMMAKTYRIARIFRAKELTISRLDDRRLFVMTVAFALPLILVGILWMIVAPLHVYIVVPDPLRPAFNYTTCTSNNWNFGYVIAGLVYAYLGITAVLAFAVRGAYSVFNEAEPIASTVYLLSFTLSVVGATQLSEGNDYNIQFLIRSLGVIIASMVSVAILFVRRIISSASGKPSTPPNDNNASVFATLNKKIVEAHAQTTQFLAFICHEIRNPLHAIVGINACMANMPMTVQQRECVQSIGQSAQLMSAIVNDVLDLSKVQAGTLRMTQVPFDLHELVKELRDIYQISPENREVSWSTSVAGDVPRIVIGDPIRLRQILINLLSNAFKFTDHGSVKLLITKSNSAARIPPRGQGISHHGHGRDHDDEFGHEPQYVADDHVVLDFRVTDTGIGIPPDQMSTLFQPYSQMHLLSDLGGRGLGLSLVKSLVEALGGEVFVESKVNEGSCFSFHLTMASVATAHESTPVAPTWSNSSIGNTDVSLRLEDGSRVPLTNIEMSSPAIVTDKAAVAAPVSAQSHATVRSSTRWRVLPINDINETDTKQSPMATTDVSSVRSPSVAPVEYLPSFIFLPIRVLLVEDNLINQKLGMRILTKPGLLPDLAVDGIHALEKCGFTDVNNQSAPLTPAAAPAPLIAANSSTPIGSNVVLNHRLGSPLPSSGVSSLPNGSSYSTLPTTSPASRASISCSYDIILMDIEMPRMNGIKATQELRNRGVNIPIVAVTANAMIDQRKACLMAGCSDFLAKPFHPAQLLSLILEVSAVRTRNDVDVTTALANQEQRTGTTHTVDDLSALRAWRKREMQQLWF